MNFKLNSGMNLAIISAELKITLPNYKIELLKNPITRFEYIQVRKSALIGVWIRIFEKKEIIKLMGCVPSPMARIIFSGLLPLLFLFPSQKKVKLDIKNVLVNKFKINEIK